MRDVRLGRFFAIDPLASKYPYNSPYAFSENRVLDAIELEGLEMSIAIYKRDDNGSVTAIKIVVDIDVLNEVNMSDEDFKQRLDEIKKDAEEIYKGKVDLYGKTLDVSLELNLNEISTDDLANSTFALFFKSEEDFKKLSAIDPLGNTQRQGNTQVNEISISADPLVNPVNKEQKQDIKGKFLGNIFNHELGHSLGFGHRKKNKDGTIPKNVMKEGLKLKGGDTEKLNPVDKNQLESGIKTILKQQKNKEIIKELKK